MTEKSPYRVVGKVKDAHGLKGELYLILFAHEASWIGKLKELRLKASENAEPLLLKIKSARMHKGGLIILTSDLHNRNEAEALKGHLFEIPSELLTSNKGESIYLTEIEGFRVEFKGLAEVGEVTGFSSNTAQDLLIVKIPRGQFEIPFVKAFVTRIDYAERVIYFDLPPGLLGELDDEKVVSDGGTDNNSADDTSDSPKKPKRNDK